MSDYYKVAEKTFEAELVMEYSSLPTAKPLGRHVSTMTLYYNKDDTGWIDWDIPALDEYENIGLRFEFDRVGKRTLVDYDGIMCLPGEAVELLRENGVTVTEEFE